MQFGERAREIGANINYAGETASVLCHNFIKNLMLLHRDYVDHATTKSLLQRPEQVWKLRRRAHIIRGEPQ